jgi:hypothetical protein
MKARMTEEDLVDLRDEIEKAKAHIGMLKAS